ncbi:MAG TPA: sugar phosphate isomerase/epimerase [Clostridiales bacterium]|nr:sugar phosphate isomerase/epimerase [Clostridiales bacterium]
MKKFGVGIQLYGVRNAMKEDFEGTLRKLAEMGYEYVEFAGYFDKTGEEIKNILDKYGLKCVSVHQRCDFFDEDPEEKIKFLKTFGVKYVVQPWYEVSKLAGTPEWDDTVKKFRATADLLKAHGMMFGYHNHDFEFQKYEGKYLHDYIFDAIPKDEIVPELDTCWVHYAGIRPEEKIREFAGRVQIVHLKDFVCKKLAAGPVYDLIDTKGGSTKKPASREENGFEFRPLGMGIQDFGAILKACEESGTETVIVEQDQVYDGMTELEAAKISRDYLKEKFGL